MKAVSSIAPHAQPASSAVEILLSERHAAFLEQLRLLIGPDMPVAFGWPHAIRTILERIEESGIDLTAASSEEEIAFLGAKGLRVMTTKKPAVSTESLSASKKIRSAVPRENRSNRPETDRFRSGKPLRSNHG